MNPSPLLLLLFISCATPPALVAELERGLEEVRKPLVLSAGQAKLVESASGLLEGRELLKAAFVASGVVQPEALAQRMAQVDALERALREPQLPEAKDDLARELLARLHRRTFRRYSPRDSSPLSVLDSGRFNCVSATLFFNALLRSFGVPSEVVDSPTHVLSHVYVLDRWVEVETTSARGFDPFRSEEDYQRFLKERGLRTGYQRLSKRGAVEAVLIKRRAGEVRTVKNAALPGFIVSNDAIVAAEAGQTERAWRLYELAKRLLPGDRRLSHNADVFLHNLALGHHGAGDWHRVLKLLIFALGEPRGGDIGRNLRTMMVHAFDRLAFEAVGRQDTAELERILRMAHKRAGPSEILDHNHAIHISRLARALARDEGTAKGALRLIERHLKWNEEYLANHYVHIVMARVTRHESRQEREQAKELIERSIAVLSAIGKVRTELGILEEMLGLAHFREEDYGEAATHFRKALKLGGSSTSRSNLGASLFNAALKAIEDGDCPRALGLAREAESYSEGNLAAHVEERCAR